MKFRYLLVSIGCLIILGGVTDVVLKMKKSAIDPSAYDCKDFVTQAQAQVFFEAHDPDYDPYHLDTNHDGIACQNYEYGLTPDEDLQYVKSLYPDNYNKN